MCVDLASAVQYSGCQADFNCAHFCADCAWSSLCAPHTNVFYACSCELHVLLPSEANLLPHPCGSSWNCWAQLSWQGLPAAHCLGAVAGAVHGSIRIPRWLCMHWGLCSNPVQSSSEHVLHGFDVVSCTPSKGDGDVNLLLLHALVRCSKRHIVFHSHCVSFWTLTASLHVSCTAFWFMCRHLQHALSPMVQHACLLAG